MLFSIKNDCWLLRFQQIIFHAYTRRNKNNNILKIYSNMIYEWDNEDNTYTCIDWHWQKTRTTPTLVSTDTDKQRGQHLHLYRLTLTNNEDNTYTCIDWHWQTTRTTHTLVSTDTDKKRGQHLHLYRLTLTKKRKSNTDPTKQTLEWRVNSSCRVLSTKSLQLNHIPIFNLWHRRNRRNKVWWYN